MGFIGRTNNKNKKPIYKRRGLKIFLFVLGLVLVFTISYFGYLYASGIKMFAGGITSDSLISKALKGGNGLGTERINILLMGRGGINHPGGLLTDSIMLVSIEPNSKKIATISIPRDLLVTIKGHGQDKINSAFSDGYNEYYNKNCTGKKSKDGACIDEALKSGAELTKTTVADTIGLPINYYFVIDFEGFKQFIDALGGVDVNVEKAIVDYAYPDAKMTGYDPFKIKAGNQHLDGATALKYARSRESTSDFDRSRRQQQIIVAVKEKIVSSGTIANPKKLSDLIKIVGDHIRTDLTPAELKALAEFGQKIDTANIISRVLSNGGDGLLISDSSSGTYYLKPKSGNFDAIKRMIQNIFEDTSVQDEKAKIEIQNGSGVAGTGTKLSETLEDLGFNVVNVKNAASNMAKTQIIDYSKSTKPKTIEYLKKGLKVTAETKSSTNQSSGSSVDITIIIGEDYSVFTKP